MELLAFHFFRWIWLWGRSRVINGKSRIISRFLVCNREHGGAIGQHRVMRSRFLWRKLVFSLEMLRAKGLWKVPVGMSSRKVEMHVLRREIRAGNCEQSSPGW